MGARTKGWARTVAQNSATSTASGKLVASTDTSVTPSDAAVAALSDRADGVVFLVAGVAQQIRWGGRDGFTAAGTNWGAGLATNTAEWRCDVMYETTQTSVANDTTTVAGAGGDVVDRTFSFTPTVTGTYRLKVNLVVTATTGGAAVANANTDEGNFGSASPVYLAGRNNQSFTPGLIAVGKDAPANFFALNGGTPRYYLGAPTHTFTLGAASQGSDSSESCAVSVRDGSDVQFKALTIAAGTSATKNDAGYTVNNTVPIASTSVGIHFSFNNSALSTALGGAGIPWSFIPGALPTGWTQVAGNSIGATEVKASGLYTIDPRWDGTDHLLQINDSTFGTPPMNKNLASGARQTSELAFVATGWKDMGGTRISTGTFTEKLWDSGNLTGSEASPTRSRTSTLSTQGGQNGWSDGFLTWSDSLPGGNWMQKEVILTPATAVGLEVNNTRTLVLLAKNPNFQVIPAGGNAANALAGTHFYAGNDFIGGGVLIDFVNKVFPAVDVSPAPTAFIGRFNLGTASIEYLDSDYTWKLAATNQGNWYKWPMVRASTLGGDPNAWIVIISGAYTSSWKPYSPKAFPIIFNNGTPYGLPGDALMTLPERQHNVAGLEWGGVPP